MHPLTATATFLSNDPIEEVKYDMMIFYRDYYLVGSKHVIGWYTER
jgi:hypothetical protein